MTFCGILMSHLVIKNDSVALYEIVEAIYLNIREVLGFFYVATLHR